MNVKETGWLSKLVSIGITTKNRWKDLEITLSKLEELNLSDIEILIFDDASDNPCPINLSKFALNISSKRFNESQGLIVRRNQLAREIKSKYYLSLDDDSYPIQNSLREVINFADSNDDRLLCLSFPIYNPTIGKYQNFALKDKPYQVRSFIGCGHLLHRENFLRLGGYSEELIHQGEEMDIAARGFNKGLICYHFPHLMVHHTASNSGRSWHRMDFYGARNNVLWNDWFVPHQLKLYRQSRTLLSRMLLALKVQRLGQLQGEWSGFRNINKYLSLRDTMSIDKFRCWQKLPHS